MNSAMYLYVFYCEGGSKAPHAPRYYTCCIKFKCTTMPVYDIWHSPQCQIDILALLIMQQTGYYICARAICHILALTGYIS